MLKCVNCEAPMEEQGIMHTGNAQYHMYSCESCGSEDAQCLGVLSDM